MSPGQLSFKRKGKDTLVLLREAHMCLPKKYSCAYRKGRNTVVLLRETKLCFLKRKITLKCMKKLSVNVSTVFCSGKHYPEQFSCLGCGASRQNYLV